MGLPQLAEILRCPETRQKLSVAPPELLQWMRDEQDAGRLFYKSGKYVTGELKAGLVREDGRMFYPVEYDIPLLTRDEAILLLK